ncbi:cytochrome P450 [Ramaria rubella]|nr:cytochrome P450 [Ramaria rubella]
MTFQDFILKQPYLASVILCFLVFLIYEASGCFNDSSNKSTHARKFKPPRVKYYLPWIGSAIEMGKNPDAFFQRASAKHGPVFRIKTVGQEMTYITSPNLISAVYRDVKTFEFIPIRLDITENIFGLSHEATHSSFLLNEYLPMHHRGLSPKNMAGLLHRYTQYAHEFVLKTLEKYDGSRTSLVPFMVPPAYSSAAGALFGRAFDAEKSYKPFRTFDDQFHIMLAGVPRFLMPGTHRAWDQVIKQFEQYLKTPHEDSSELMLLIEAGARDAGWSGRDIATTLSCDLWALQANAVYAAYWVIALELQKPQGLSALTAEVDQARRDWQSQFHHAVHNFSENQHQWILDGSFPLLTSAIQEALRISTSSFSIRRVVAPVEFAGFHFEAGERLICVTRSVHLDEEIHPDPHEFRSERYADGQNKFKKNGKIVPNHTMPFGGGDSMCEGRHFALGELKVYLALILTYVTIELDPGSNFKPKFFTARMGVGTMPPVGDLTVNIRRREATQ